jgi:hypothetical protein
MRYAGGDAIGSIVLVGCSRVLEPAAPCGKHGGGLRQRTAISSYGRGLLAPGVGRGEVCRVSSIDHVVLLPSLVPRSTFLASQKLKMEVFA